MRLEYKHGLSQYRLNNAKSYAQSILETVQKIEIMFQLSQQELIDEELAENYIKINIDKLDMDWGCFQGYIKQREDMR